MTQLGQKRVILGVSGGIAAYKAAELCSLLMKAGAEVRVAMSESASRFITPLTFEALTQHPVYTQVFDTPSSFEMEHITWARWADLLVYAPASADLLARLAHGHADDALTTLHLSFAGPVVVAPAMNTQMWNHAATHENVETLRRRGVTVVEPESGRLACGDVGPGRLAALHNILQASGFHAPAGMPSSEPPPPLGDELAGKTVLITSGPTHEYIDPVRFISNPSSGRMGAALADAASRHGATVHFVTGPVNDQLLPSTPVQLHPVTTAEQMLKKVKELAEQVDMFIFAAAVGDFRVAHTVRQKIKRSGNSITLPLVENPDIAQAIGFSKRDGQLTVGFAAETDDLAQNATAKLEKKNLDVVIANDVSDASIGFDSRDNEVTLFFRNSQSRSLPKQSKDALGQAIIKELLPFISASN